MFAGPLMTNSAIRLLSALALLLTGCAGAPEQPGLPTSIVIKDSAADAPVLLAQQAFSDGQWVYVRFQSPTGTVNSSAPLEGAQTALSTGGSVSTELQRAIEQHNDLPIAPLAYLDPEQWIMQTHDQQTLPVAGVALWRAFRDRMIASVTPRKPGKGIAVEFLKQEELFFYFDEQGLLRSTPLHEKPAALRTARTYRFSRLLADAGPLLGDYISAAGSSTATALLFNTGDTADFGYPFVYASLDGRVVFLRRLPGNLECCDPVDVMMPELLLHATRSHLGCLLTQPIGSVARLFSLATFKVVDTVTPKPFMLLDQQPVPPVSGSGPMDSEKWEQELGEVAYSPLSQGTVEYLVDGAAFFTRLIDAIQSAQSSIDVQLYIFDNDDYALKIADLLKQRSREVRVRVLIDGLGTISAASQHSPSMPKQYQPPPRIVHYLEDESDIKVRTVLNPWLAGDHTKTILIDKRIAFIGGMNIGREYRYDWHDMMVELRGPVVDEIQTNFEKAWRQQAFLGDIRAALYRPRRAVNEPGPDDIPIRLLFTKPGDYQILRAQLAAIARARQRIYIENAYFTSDDIIFELAQARRRGVDVRVIIPYESDSGIIDRSNVRAINTMLDNGIRVYLYPGASHIKGAIYDGWVCLGSANFDQLSLRMNKELNIASSSPAVVQGFLDSVILPDFAKSVELTEPLPETWSDILLETIADQL